MADIIVSENIQGPSMDALMSDFDVHWNDSLWNDVEALTQAVSEARAIIVRNQTQINEALLTQAPNLKVIARAGAGLDNVDTQAAVSRNVTVCYAPRENSLAVAELAMGFMLNLARFITSANNDTKEGNWNRSQFVGTELSGKTLGVVGFGRIGQMVARRAKAFDMKLCAFDKYLPHATPVVHELDVEMLPLDGVLAASDYVSCHVPLMPDTRHLFGVEQFNQMKSGAVFINTSRGEVVDEMALVDALVSEHLRAAATDVRESEPPKPGGLADLENVLVTPHIGAFSEEAQCRVVDTVCADVRAVLTGVSPTSVFAG